MKRSAIIVLHALIIAISPLSSSATSGKSAAPDCSVARDPRRCEAQQAAREACSGLQGEARAACIREALPPPDCSRAPNAIQCQAHQSAMAACKDKHGKAHRQCLHKKTGSN